MATFSYRFKKASLMLTKKFLVSFDEEGEIKNKEKFSLFVE
jgi:hypothetical protein